MRRIPVATSGTIFWAPITRITRAPTDASGPSWLPLAAQVPSDSYGGCRVAVCPEPAYSPLGLCHGHESAYRFQGSPGVARLPEAWFGRFEPAGRPVPVSYDDETGFGRWCQAA